mmetsp:Transcript_21838/g.64407  ORF Transcript_21838/g.64407 Transcript_21838/m.64407 type:complete len:210 (-) Transcript_21838:209-838(-)
MFAHPPPDAQTPRHTSTLPTARAGSSTVAVHPRVPNPSLLLLHPVAARVLLAHLALARLLLPKVLARLAEAVLLGVLFVNQLAVEECPLLLRGGTGGHTAQFRSINGGWDGAAEAGTTARTPQSGTQGGKPRARIAVKARWLRRGGLAATRGTRATTRPLHACASAAARASSASASAAAAASLAARRSLASSSSRFDVAVSLSAVFDPV